MRNWQQVIRHWVITTFGQKSQDDPRERYLRLFEEVVELGQAIDQPSDTDDLLKIIDRVYNKPKGKPRQEFGGVMVTLCALADNQKVILLEELIDEHRRICSPGVQEKLQQSQRNKLESGL